MLGLVSERWPCTLPMNYNVNVRLNIALAMPDQELDNGVLRSLAAAGAHKVLGSQDVTKADPLLVRSRV